MPDAPPPIPRTGAGAQARRPLPARNAGEPEPEPAPEMAGDPATIVVAHTARKIPRRQLSVRRGEAVTVVEQSLDGWWEIQTAEGALGIVPALKVQIQAAGEDCEASQTYQLTQLSDIEMTDIHGRSEAVLEARSLQNQWLPYVRRP